MRCALTRHLWLADGGDDDVDLGGEGRKRNQITRPLSVNSESSSHP